MAHDGMVEQLRAERDAALEEIAFLREQLRSTRAYHLHELEEQCAHLHAERKLLLRQLAIFGERLHRRSRREFASDGERATNDGADAFSTR